MASIKSIFCHFFNEHDHIESKHVSFRLYNPKTDEIIPNFNVEDWGQIFTDVNETMLKEWTVYDDRVLLSCIDKEKNQLFGILVIFETNKSEKSICFHGGIWRHNRRSIMLAYEGLYKMIQFLLDNGLEVLTTCKKTNKRASMLHKQFGFVEFGDDDILSCKYLDVKEFESNNLPRRLEKYFLHEQTPI